MEKYLDCNIKENLSRKEKEFFIRVRSDGNRAGAEQLLRGW